VETEAEMLRYLKSCIRHHQELLEWVSTKQTAELTFCLALRRGGGGESLRFSCLYPYTISSFVFSMEIDTMVIKHSIAFFYRNKKWRWKILKI
jgi:hypothetical protein